MSLKRVKQLKMIIYKNQPELLVVFIWIYTVFLHQQWLGVFTRWTYELLNLDFIVTFVN